MKIIESVKAKPVGEEGTESHGFSKFERAGLLEEGDGSVVWTKAPCGK